MKEWQKKIIEGMKLIKEGCSEVKDGKECLDCCPFGDLCVIDKYVEFPGLNPLDYWPKGWNVPEIEETEG